MRKKLLLTVLFLLALIGLVLSMMALDLHIAHEINPANSGGSYCSISKVVNCETVIQSDWSMLWGIPLALYGVLFYLALAGVLLLSMIFRGVPYKPLLNILLLIAAVTVIDSLFLLYISVFKIETLCPVCAGVYVVNFIFLGLIYFVGRGESILTRIREGFTSIVLLPVRFFTVWKSGTPTGQRLFALSLPLVLLLSVPVSEYIAQLLRERIVTKELQNLVELPWPKDYTVPDTIALDRGAFGDYFIGSKGAPITIVEFFDYQCGYCRFFYRELHELLKSYKGQYQVIFKNFPLDGNCNRFIPSGQGHAHACYSAKLARCAGEQGKFQEVSDFILTADLFAEEETFEESRATLDSTVKIFGLDTVEMEKCMASERQLKVIEADIELGQSLGLEGTPAVWVNGKQVPDIDSRVLKTIFDDILAQQ